MDSTISSQLFLGFLFTHWSSLLFPSNTALHQQSDDRDQKGQQANTDHDVEQKAKKLFFHLA
jgi:hypothetical protein